LKHLSKPALIRLQTLCGQAAQHVGIDNTRETRLAWATHVLGHQVASFSLLTPAHAKTLIDALQATLGIAETSPARRGYTSRSQREKQGTEGRRDQLHVDATMLSGDEEVLQLILSEQQALGWDDDARKRFLRGRSGPLGGRDTIHTLGDANKVHWAMKRMRQHAQKERAA
jgi:hypothetical protein